MKKRFVLPQPFMRWHHRLQIWINHKRIHSTPNDLSVIGSTDHTALCKWWNMLNSWEWPDELLPAEPQKYIPGGRRSQLMDLIKSIVGERAINRYGNKDRMTDEDHEDFWNNAYRGSGDYVAFSERCKLRKRIRDLEERVDKIENAKPEQP